MVNFFAGLSFVSPTFAIAGFVAALGPLLIHLVRRLHSRKLPCAAMRLLKEAASSSRRSLALRDYALWAIRTACVLLFGLAMAQPYIARKGALAGPGGAVHAVLIVDNSLSMGYQQLEGTLLDQAKGRARELVAGLPPGSRISVLPLCGSDAGLISPPHRTIADALAAISAIEVTDQKGSAALAIKLAREACRNASDPSAKRIVFIGDQQASNWPLEVDQQSIAGLSELQVVSVGEGPRENTWVEAFDIQDGVADGQNQTLLWATVRHEGTAPRRDLQVTLTVDGEPVASETIDLIPGVPRQVSFMHRFSPLDDGQVSVVPVEVSIPADRLPADDRRYLAAPVGSALPIVFVDELGESESAATNLLGETHALRRWLSAGEHGRPLAAIRHSTIDSLDAALLADARLVVVAGVERPDNAVGLLHEYVRRGGQLLIAAGGRFNAAAWTKAAWGTNDELLPGPVSAMPDSNKGRPLRLNTASLGHSYFQVPGLRPAELEALWQAPLFFKSVGVDLDRKPARPIASSRRVLARFTNGDPMLVERNIGKGRVLFFSSGLSADWSTITQTSAMLLFDRILRGMLASAAPRRSFESADEIRLPLDSFDRPFQLQLRVQRPGGEAPEPLAVESAGVVIRDAHTPGFYRLTACQSPILGAEASDAPVWETTLAVNGPADESRLASVDAKFLTSRIGGSKIIWIGPGERIRIQGAHTYGLDAWRWLLAAAFGGLALELALLALWSRPKSRAETAA